MELDYDDNKPEESVSDAPEGEYFGGMCSNCGSNQTYRYAETDGDDFTWTYYCKACNKMIE